MKLTIKSFLITFKISFHFSLFLFCSFSLSTRLLLSLSLLRELKCFRELLKLSKLWRSFLLFKWEFFISQIFFFVIKFFVMSAIKNQLDNYAIVKFRHDVDLNRVESIICRHENVFVCAFVSRIFNDAKEKNDFD